jgi:hypothetical protein
MAGIKNQTVESDIIVWDNSGDYPEGSGEDVLIWSSKNFYCQPRFLIAGTVKTPYIYNQDDDLAIKDPNLFEKFLEHSERYPDFVIGWNGRKFSKDINWDKAYQSPGKGWIDTMDKDDKSSIDMINVGVSFFPTEILNELLLNPFCKAFINGTTKGFTEEEYKYADDIIISYYLSWKRVMPFKLIEKYDWLNEYESRGAALSKQVQHMNVRNRICKRLFYGKYSD